MPKCLCVKLSGFVHINEGKILDIFDHQTIAENRLFYTHMEKLQLLSTQEKQHRYNCLVDIFRRNGTMPSTIHIPIYTNPLINQLRDIRLTNTSITQTPITPSPLSTDTNTKSADNTINEQTKTPVKQDQEITGSVIIAYDSGRRTAIK